ncbi:unnamed protein product [Didymodactylos carnosus]|uniref:Uncharacterized protein n=1 Tax=Didymodactylos carnosus TaxID=1234261 RepID=A0A814AUP2_9BILA|nr:unnamed protein product [Didymodactylos carnosus]CAF0917859.1 unnamed protein product [Didymodactylos carnosus]CAF3543395.1 unnamed protein product [Didymodactylos carnosus]CAF3697734.1 unnamed protein product [Didymodactylos carnosus]
MSRVANFLRLVPQIQAPFRSNFVQNTNHIVRMQSTSVNNNKVSEKLNESSSSEPKTGDQFASDDVHVHVTPMGKWVLVIGGLYRRPGDVPDVVPNRPYQKAWDRFRARCIILSIVLMGLVTVVQAVRGKRAYDKGLRYTDDVYNLHSSDSKLHRELAAAQRPRQRADRHTVGKDHE